MTVKILTVLCLVLISAQVFAKKIEPSNKRIRYVGRIDFEQKKSPKISWSGTSIEAHFSGNKIEVILDDQSGKNRFNVFVDGQFKTPFIIICKKGKHTYDISKRLKKKKKHHLLITKRTGGTEGHTHFNGLVLSETGGLYPLKKRPKLRIEFIGDSITSGTGNEMPDDGGDLVVSGKNNYLAYGAITARKLKAEYVCISRSGIGLIKGWPTVTMPDYFEQLLATGSRKNGTQWDFKKWVPHLVVINLFQNDNSLVDKMKVVPSDEERIAAYIKFIKQIRKRYRKASIVCTLGTMSAIKGPWPGYIKAAVKKTNADGDSRVYAYIFKDQGWGRHPRLRHHKKMAEELVKFIKTNVSRP